ncbi:MAG: segregation/condensation protein A [Candidatus Margulisbacteria bacterium]|jgi:segregation and condensation protein A|nr:segregation/condensation protein A [Candidatus Margulisiibacteriota bacterium]
MTEEQAYQVKLDIFEGPFDLLLKAIDDGEIELHRVSLAQITASYFEYWRREEPNLILAADFLYLAAYLYELKVRQLLPRPEESEQVEELTSLEESLAKHIEEYQLFKQIAQELRERKSVFAKVYGRHEGEEVEGEMELVNLSLRDLVVAFQKVYREAVEREKIVGITAESITIDQRIAEIRQMVAERRAGVPFPDLFIRKTRLEVVVTFLAVLELAKQRFLTIVQDRRFATIMIFAAAAAEEGKGIEHGTDQN